MPAGPSNRQPISQGAESGEVWATVFWIWIRGGQCHEAAEHDCRELRDRLDERLDLAGENTMLGWLTTDIDLDQNPRRTGGVRRNRFCQALGINRVDQAGGREHCRHLSPLQMSDEVEYERIADDSALCFEVLQPIFADHGRPRGDEGMCLVCGYVLSRKDNLDVLAGATGSSRGAVCAFARLDKGRTQSIHVDHDDSITIRPAWRPVCAPSRRYE